MSEFEVWAYRLIIAALAIVVWFAIQRLIRKFDELIGSINDLTTNYKLQQAQITSVLEQLRDITTRLNDHGKRIRAIEYKKAKQVTD